MIDAMLRKHNITNIGAYSLTTILILLYIDDGAIPFASRRDVILGMKLCINVFRRFGLVVHTGTKEKDSKTKAVFFPGTSTIQRWRRNGPNHNEIDYVLDGNALHLTRPSQMTINLTDAYEYAPETAVIIINERETIPFTINFCYLGPVIDFLIDDTTDMKSRVSKASKAMGALVFIWKTPQICLDTKIKLFLAIPVNLALWNCKTWSGNKMDMNILDVFFHKSIRRILGISMTEVKERSITNIKLRKRFGNINSLSHIMTYRRLKFVGRTVRQDLRMLLQRILTSFTPGNLIRGRPFRTNREAIAEAIRILIPSTPKSAPLKYWFEYACDGRTWEKMIKSLFKQTYPPFFVQGYNTRSRSIPQSPPSHTSPPSPSNSESSTPLPPSTPPRTSYFHPQNSPNFNLDSNQMTTTEARAILNVGINASRREISLKFKILSRKYHPDKLVLGLYSDSYAERTKKFQIIANARDLLVG